ncbi:DMT family transporter [Candidatus Woesearchaeota archaeon]|nr:DMT family transporter [Candidatus Woesearchaeota archaeon]
MLWVLYSLLSAFSWATADAFTKKVSNADDYILMLARFLYASPFVLLLLFFIPMPRLESGFWLVLCLSIPLEVLAWVLYIKAIRNADLSLVVPFLSLTPLFLVLTSFVILGELPSIIGFFGIMLVVFGAYILNFKDIRKGILEPFKSVFKEKSCVYMIIVAFLFSITANLGKIIIQKSSALFFSAIYLPCIAMPFLAISFFASRKNLVQLGSNFKMLFFSGLFFGLILIFHALAIQLVIVPYMISIKRTSSIFSVLYGWLLFKEKNIPFRLIGAVVMIIGAALIILF